MTYYDFFCKDSFSCFFLQVSLFRVVLLIWLLHKSSLLCYTISPIVGGWSDRFMFFSQWLWVWKWMQRNPSEFECGSLIRFSGPLILRISGHPGLNLLIFHKPSSKGEIEKNDFSNQRMSYTNKKEFWVKYTVVKNNGDLSVIILQTCWYHFRRSLVFCWKKVVW